MKSLSSVKDNISNSSEGRYFQNPLCEISISLLELLEAVPSALNTLFKYDYKVILLNCGGFCAYYYCAIVLPTPVDEILGCTTNFGPKRNLPDISSNFRGRYCLDSSKMSRINSLGRLLSLEISRNFSEIVRASLFTQIPCL